MHGSPPLMFFYGTARYPAPTTQLLFCPDTRRIPSLPFLQPIGCDFSLDFSIHAVEHDTLRADQRA